MSIDTEKVAQAAAILGTETNTATVDAALEEVVRKHNLELLAEITGSESHIDPDVLATAREKAWG